MWSLSPMLYKTKRGNTLPISYKKEARLSVCYRKVTRLGSCPDVISQIANPGQHMNSDLDTLWAICICKLGIWAQPYLLSTACPQTPYLNLFISNVLFCKMVTGKLILQAAFIMFRERVCKIICPFRRSIASSDDEGHKTIQEIQKATEPRCSWSHRLFIFCPITVNTTVWASWLQDGCSMAALPQGTVAVFQARW